jgi:hypothetical protein
MESFTRRTRFSVETARLSLRSKRRFPASPNGGSQAGFSKHIAAKNAESG